MLNNLFEEELMQNDQKIRVIMFSPLSTIYILADYGYFWTVPDNFLYHFHLFFETSLVTFSSLTAVSVENVFGFYVYQFNSTMRAMTSKLMNSPHSENFSDLLRTCLAKHQKLLQCRNTLEHIFGPIVFWHICTNAVMLCSSLYEFASLPNINFKHISEFLTYALVKLLQTFIYTWYGTVLISASEDFRKGVYFGEWFKSGLDRQMRTNVIMILMQKPMIINAFYAPVDITIFTSFVNAAMSYFFLLQSIGSKGKP
ncbi:PREDICTED: odorant receptor 46a, isoform A-like [Wasmannia auropunctata]|uniref:odorant receptor 46a, isoform A-like n=1 Tax=Wasmannia auropunctata TaxID=64793 RepID=UPI0005F0BF70|nr:PREDICTED: odorant receptor 46a, isoform A-like [Wasmannia auropunctata]